MISPRITFIPFYSRVPAPRALPLHGCTLHHRVHAAMKFHMQRPTRTRENGNKKNVEKAGKVEIQKVTSAPLNSIFSSTEYTVTVDTDSVGQLSPLAFIAG